MSLVVFDCFFFRFRWGFERVALTPENSDQAEIRTESFSSVPITFSKQRKAFASSSPPKIIAALTNLKCLQF